MVHRLTQGVYLPLRLPSAVTYESTHSSAQHSLFFSREMAFKHTSSARPSCSARQRASHTIPSTLLVLSPLFSSLRFPLAHDSSALRSLQHMNVPYLEDCKLTRC